MSPNEAKLQAESRTEFGKGAARRIRRADKVPAVLYGHGTDPVHITLPGHDTMMALKHGGANALLSIELDGDSQLALPKQVQQDPVKGFLEHLDLIIVRRGEKVTVDVPIIVTGEAAAETMVTTEHNSDLARGRGHPHPRVHRGVGRGRRGRHPDPRQGPHPARRLEPAGRRGHPDRPRDRCQGDRPGGGAGGGRGRRGTRRARARGPADEPPAAERSAEDAAAE